MNYNEEYVLLKDKSHVFKSINYERLMKMINSFQTGVVLIGGPWSKNCQAVMGIINDTAKDTKIRSIYNYDPHFRNVFKEEVDLRDCSDLETKLKYYELIEKIGYKSDILVQDTFIPRLSVPAVIGLKNGGCVGIIADEYVSDAYGLHFEGEKEDKTAEYVSKLKSLFEEVKSKIKNIKIPRL